MPTIGLTAFRHATKLQINSFKPAIKELVPPAPLETRAHVQWLNMVSAAILPI
jgi:hypothetical protein